MTPEFTLTLDRHGGFAGVSMRAELHSADLTPEEAQQVWALVETAPLRAATDASSGRGRGVPCLTAARQRLLHTGYETRPQDVHDLGLLTKLGGANPG